VRGPRGESWEDRTRDLLIQAGIEGVSPRQLLGVSIGLGFVVFVLVLGTSQVPVIALLFGGFAGCGPLVLGATPPCAAQTIGAARGLARGRRQPRERGARRSCRCPRR
jgi:hypothetical protein